MNEPLTASLELWEILDGLNSLADKSLVQIDEGGECPRFRLLETVRQYARERLLDGGEAQLIRDRHFRVFLNVAESSITALNGPAQKHWLDLLDADHENFCIALDFSEDTGNDGQGGLRLSGALMRYWWLRGYRSEGRARIESALAHSRSEERNAARARALNALGNLLWANLPAARERHEESLRILRELGDRPAIARSLNDLAVVLYMQGDFRGARRLLEESLELLREAKDWRGVAVCLSNISNQAFEMGDYAEACSLSESALAIARESGDPNATAIVLTNLGTILNELCEYERARMLFQEALAIRHEIQDPLGVAAAYFDLSSTHFLSGDLPAARQHAEDALRLSNSYDDKIGIGFASAYLAMTLAELGDYEAARSHIREGEQVFEQLSDEFGLATASASRGYVELAAGDFSASRLGFAKSISLASKRGSRHLIARGLEGLAAVEAAIGEARRAVMISSAARKLRTELGSQTPTIFANRLGSAVAQARRELGEERFSVALEEGSRLTWEQAIGMALERPE